MNAQLLQQANYVLDSCGRQIPPPNTNYVDIPAHIMYSRFLASDGTTGSNDIGGVQHKGKVSFFLRALTAQILPRFGGDGYWRLRLPDGKFFQSALTCHSMAFGFGSNRQAFVGGIDAHSEAVEWKPGEKVYVDLSTTVGGVPASPGVTVTMQFEGIYRFPIKGTGAVGNLLGRDMPRYFLNEPQNILAPETAFGPGCPSETPAGFQDEEYWYVSPIAQIAVDAAGASATVSNVATQIEPGCDFIMRAIWPYFPGPFGGTVVVRLRRGDGYAMTNNFIPINAIQGPSIFRELRIKGGDTFSFDAQCVDTAGPVTCSFGLLLYGVRRRRVA